MIAIPKCLGDCPHLRLRFKASISCPDRGLSPVPSDSKASIARWDRGLSPGPSDSKASISCRATDPRGVCPHLHRNASVPSDATRGLSPFAPKISISCPDRGLSPVPSDSKASIARWDRGLSPGSSDSKASISCRATDPRGVCPPGPLGYRATI
jgi:hypothetical protein